MLEIQEIIKNLKEQLPFLRKYSDANVLKYYLMSALNNLKEERNDTEKLMGMFKNGEYEKLETELDNNPKLLEVLNIYQIILN